MNETQFEEFDKEEELRQTRMITGYYKDVRYTGKFGKMDVSVNKWNDAAQKVVVAGYTKKVVATDGSYYILPEGDEWMLGDTIEEFILKAKSYILGYETRAEREAIFAGLKSEDYSFYDLTSGAGKDLRFTGEVIIDRSLFLPNPDSKFGFRIHAHAKLVTTDGRAYTIKDEESPSKFMTGENDEEIVMKAKAYAMGYMDRIKKEEML